MRIETSAPPRWAEVPTPTQRSVARSPRWPAAVVAVAVAAIPPAARALRIDAPAAAIVAAVLVVAAGLTARTDQWVARLGIAAVAGAVVVPWSGSVTGAWAAAGLVLADWAARGRPPVPGLVAGEGALGPVAALSAVAAYQGWSRADELPHLLPTAGAFVVTAVIAVTGDRLTGLVAVAARRVGRAVGATLFAVIGLVVIVLPWVAHRLFRLDPLAPGHGHGWLPRTRATTNADHLWAPDATDQRPRRWRRIRSAVAVPVTVLLMAAAAYVVVGRGSPGDGEARDRGGALAGLTWWPEYAEELDWAFHRPGGAVNPAGFPPMHDIVSRYINVRDGRRVSWQAPAGDGPRLRVWMYGGSTMLGYGQRDEHTIASEVARLAWADGIAVDVVNRGISGDLAWEEAQRFAWDLASEPPPDLVVFYDGSNDLRAATDVNDAGGPGLNGWPIDFKGDNAATEYFDDNPIVQRFFGRPPDGARRTASTTAPRLTDDEVGRYVIRQYDRGRLPAVAAAQRVGVPVAWFWQPDRFTRPAVATEPHNDEGFDARQRRVHDVARAELPADVHDLGDVFDGSDDAVYWDDVHTNEAGARTVAAAIYESIRPQLVDAGG